jgi:HEAT repeat protein
VPDLDISFDWDSKTSELVVNVKQTQNIDGDNPAFAFELPIWVDEHGAATKIGRKAGAGAKRLGAVWCESKTDSARFKLAAEPSMVVVDPYLSVLGRMRIDQPRDRWLRQLELGPTWAARVQAIRALASDPSKPAVAALSRLARDDKADVKLRGEAIKSLAKSKSAAAVIEATISRHRSPDFTVDLLEAARTLVADPALESSQRARLKDFITNRAAPDSGQRERAAAIEALGELKATDRLALVLSAADTPSQHDKIRQAALGALASLDAADGLPVAIHFSLPGSYNRTRPDAIRALASLAHHDKEAAYKILSGLLSDRESRAWHAAGEALVKIADVRAVGEMEKMLAAKRDPRDRATIQGWIDSLKKEPPGNQAKSAG